MNITKSQRLTIKDIFTWENSTTTVKISTKISQILVSNNKDVTLKTKSKSLTTNKFQNWDRYDILSLTCHQ